VRRSSAWLTRTAVPLLAALAFAAGGGAAEEGAVGGGGPTELIRLQVRPGREADLERFLARLVEAARKTDAPVRWRTHRRVDGERPLYVLVLQAADAAELDAWSNLTASATLERAYGAEEARRLLALREEALESMQRERFVPQPELSLDD
jgi:hypothetical protein